MEKIPCDVVRDLLPLYHDEVCSETAKKMVETHLKSCLTCQQEHKSMKDLLSKEELVIHHNINTLKIVIDTWQALMKKSFFKGMFLMSGIALTFFLTYFLIFGWNTQSVASSNFEIKNINRLDNGKIVFYVDLKDNYHVTKLKHRLDDDGIFYLVPLRSIVKKEASTYQMGEGYNILDKSILEDYYDEKINAIYYGAPNDAVLIWKKGLNLELANKELEAYFNQKIN